jgi:tetratricopeptide (TPR) repeat protein
MGRTEQARRRWAEALPVLAQVAQRRADDPMPWRELALAQAEAGDRAAYLASMRRFVALTPESHRADRLMGLARQARNAGRPDEARDWWGQAAPILAREAAERPEDPSAWRNVGNARLHLGQADEAVRAFAKVLDLTPSSRQEALWWSPDPAGIGEAFAGHEAVLTRLVLARPDDWILQVARFHYHGRRGRWGEALEALGRILALDPNDTSAREYQRALLLLTGDEAGYRRATLQVLREAALHGPIDFGWNAILDPLGVRFDRPIATEASRSGELALGVLAYREGRYEQAVRELVAELEVSTHPVTMTLSRLFQAMAHRRLGHDAEARRELAEALKVLERLGRRTGWTDASEGDLMTFGWLEWLRATLVRREAEALVLYDPIFPSDPFAR